MIDDMQNLAGTCNEQLARMTQIWHTPVRRSFQIGVLHMLTTDKAREIHRILQQAEEDVLIAVSELKADNRNDDVRRLKDSAKLIMDEIAVMERIVREGAES